MDNHNESKLANNWRMWKKLRLRIYEENKTSMGWYIRKFNNECPNVKRYPDRLHTDTSLLELAKVRDGNDAGPEVIEIRAISIQENVWKNENNEEEIMKNISKEEDGETRLWDCVLGESRIL